MKRLLLLLTACASRPPDVATGVVGDWLAGPALPTPRANHCGAVIDDWVLAIGGNYNPGSGFVATDEIAAAQLADDGTLGPWHVAGHTHSPVSECNATSDGHHLYVIDGIYDTAADAGQIWTADLDASGMLPPLVSIGALPAGVVAISSEATVRDGQILLMDSELPAEGNTTITMRTPLAPVAWTTDDWHIGFRAQAQYAFTDGFAYTLGGYGGDDANTVLADVFAAPIGSDGAVGAPVATTSLPSATAFGEAVAVDDWLFVVGGRAAVFGASGTTTVVAAQAASDGTLGAWTAATALPMPRTNHVVVSAGDYLVLTGGAVDGPGDMTVLVARVRYPQ